MNYREMTAESKPFVVAYISAYNGERSIGGVLVRAMEDVDRVVVCDDILRDLAGAIAEGMEGVLVLFAKMWNNL